MRILSGSRSDLPGTHGAEFRQKKIMIIDLHLFRIRDIVESIRKGDLDRLKLTVHSLHAFLLGKLKILQNIQGHERHNALTVWRNLAHLIVTVAHADGFHPFRFISCKVFIAEIPAEFPAFRVNLPCELTGIEGIRIRLADGFQGIGMIRQPDHIPGFIGTAFRRKRPEPRFKLWTLQGFGIALECALPHECQVRRAGIALPGIAHGRRQILRKREASKPVTDFRPGFRSAGHGHRRPAEHRHFSIHRFPVRQHLFNGNAFRGRSAGIESVQLLILCRPDEGKGIRTDAVRRGLHHG